MSDSLGKRLASARRALEVSLRDAENATLVRAKYLAALENGDYDALPNYAYVRGYLIAYCKYLNLDAADLLQLLELEMAPAQDKNKLEGVRPRKEIRAPQSAVPARTIAIIAIVVIVIAVFAIGTQRLTRGPEPLSPLPTVPVSTEPTAPVSAEPTSPPITEVSTPVAEPSRQSTPTDSALPGDPFTLRVEIAQGSSSWLKIRVDDLIAYEGILTPNDEMVWEVLDQATLEIGRPGSVKIFRDDELVEIPAGGAGTPEVTITNDEVPRR